MSRPRLTPPTFCGVRMTGNIDAMTVKVGKWGCTMIRRIAYPDQFAVGIRLGSVRVRYYYDKRGAQACANAAERWMKSIGVDTRRLSGRVAEGRSA